MPTTAPSSASGPAPVPATPPARAARRGPAPRLAWVRGTLACVLMALNTVGWTLPLFAFALVKLVLPFAVVRRGVDPLLNGIATRWIDVNGAILSLVQRTTWDVAGLEGLEDRGWVLVTSNHRSWVDILVLQRVLAHRLPMLKFFLKQQLIWVPLLGLAWWALDFPFLRRHGPEALKKNPSLRHQDREAARRACERFRLSSTSVMAFPEGTRLTAEKQARHAGGTKGAYRHLLPPKSGALAVALDAMGPQLRAAVDVTIAYPGGTPTFWDFVCGRCARVVVRVHALELPPALREGAGESASDSDERRFRARVQRWIDEVWRGKDEELAELLAERPRD